MTADQLTTLQEGIALQGQGNLSGAEACYRRIGAGSRYYADALNLRGTVQAQAGNPQAAVALMGQAVRANPHNVTAWANLGSVLRDMGSRDPAVACFRRALLVAPHRIEAAIGLETVAADDHRAWVQTICLAIDPVNRQVRIERANALATAGRHRQAMAQLRKCLLAHPGYGGAMFNLANAHRDARLPTQAERLYRRAIALQPGDGKIWNNWGLLAFTTAGWPEARRRLAMATRKSSDMPQAWLNYARATQQVEGEAAAIAPMRRGLLLDPTNTGASCEFAGLVRDLGWAQRARCLDPWSHRSYLRLALFGGGPANRHMVIRRLRQAAIVEPDAPDCWYNLAVETGRSGRPGQVSRYSRRATLIQDDRANAYLNKALYLLLLESFEAGWEAHRRRLETPESVRFRRVFAVPEWDGQPIPGRHLLLWGEQGIGDEIQFLTLVHALLAQGVRLTILTEPRLRPILRRSFATGVSVPDVARATGRPEPHFGADCHLALGDLPHRLQLFCGGATTPRPWITADRRCVTELREGLVRRNPGRLLVGITWRSTAPQTGARRSIAPALWRPLAAVPGLALVSLQYGAKPADRTAFLEQAELDIDMEHGVEPLQSLDDLVSLIDAVDLVVCPANNTVHFAGAMAKPCWTLLPNIPDWRWGLTRAESLWYPGMQVLRQTEDGYWLDVMAEVRDRLLARAAG